MTHSRTLFVGLLIAFTPMLFSHSPSCHPSSSETQSNQSVAAGMWGGEHIQIEIEGENISVEWDCANGTITPPLTLDSEGHFQAKGTFRREHGGPTRNDETSAPAAKYSGTINGNNMTLTVTLIDSSEEIGTFTLVHGKEGRVVKCR